MKNPHIAAQKKGFQKKGQTVVFIILLSISLCYSQGSPPLQEQEVLSQIIKSIYNNPAEENLGDIFSAKLILQNAIPSFLRGTFETAEDFETFAKTSLFSAVSTECGSHLEELLNQLKGLLSDGGGTEVKMPATWAIQMVDAWGKFPAGILSGHTQIPGDFLECLQIRGNYTNPNQASKETSNFKGMYCSTLLLPNAPTPEATSTTTKKSVDAKNNDRLSDANLRDSVSPEELVDNMLFGANGVAINLFPFIGTCFPSSCTKQDVETLFINFYKNTINGTLLQIVPNCFTDDKPEYDTADIAVMSLLSLIGFMCLAGSFYDLLVFRRRNQKSDSKTSTSKVDQVMRAFSVPLNTEKWLSTNVGRDELTCLHGLRFLSLSWVLLGHTWEQISYQFTWNLIDLQNMYRPFMLQTVMNGAVAVDTFFTISGALLSYNLLRELEKRKGSFNYPLMVLHRYLRLTPTYAIFVGIYASIIRYFVSGPLHGMSVKNCRKYWWYNLLYINNFIESFEEMCYGPAWYLANDMQFFLFAPLIIYPLWRWRKAGFGILGAFSIASIVAPAVIQNVKELVPSNSPFIAQKSYAKDLYISPWCRMGPYLVGIFLGYVLYYKSKNPAKFRKIPFLVLAVGWTLSTAAALGIVFGIPAMLDPSNADWTFTSVDSALYSGLHRFAWGGSMAWIIFVCVSGYGGFVNRFLSWKVFMPLGRLTFCIYISSYVVQQFYHWTQYHPVHYSMYAQTNLFFAHMVMTCIVGFIVTITMEAPFMQLEKLLVPQRKPQPKATPELPHTLHSKNNNNDK